MPIRLNIPVFIEPYPFIKPALGVKQTLPVHLEPTLVVQPEVQAKPPVCLPQPIYQYDVQAVDEG
ncbi:hypothetical protein HJG54_34440 [Leptolyngbya sp. NK1-12]|uniref:Uncharacterized protein n=1 Tax=Leptolyngbya sp. NK1-12 TaxID=2547451 RepID=A0AA97AKP2_9CYAN|nr:hypothetical protein HJG54_28475 [Leptolyngbya sp. NK1-12]WNZ28034.1 hypothetical protein HJG54_34440 [Leptolyngbya sp. NK1-12]